MGRTTLKGKTELGNEPREGESRWIRDEESEQPNKHKQGRTPDLDEECYPDESDERAQQDGKEPVSGCRIRHEEQKQPEDEPVYEESDNAVRGLESDVIGTLVEEGKNGDVQGPDEI